MFHLLKIEEIKHIDTDGSLLWQQNDIDNIFHLNGESFMLNVVFNTSGGISVPSSYYLGLDARASPQFADTLSNLSGEPTQNGYSRQAVSSLNGFSVEVVESNYRAISNVVTYSATGGAWGPVTNLFLATSSSSSGYLISTATLEAPVTLQSGQSVTVRISVGLTN
jgi:hypothetical protein